MKLAPPLFLPLSSSSSSPSVDPSLPTAFPSSSSLLRCFFRSCLQSQQQLSLICFQKRGGIRVKSCCSCCASLSKTGLAHALLLSPATAFLASFSRLSTRTISAYCVLSVPPKSILPLGALNEGRKCRCADADNGTGFWLRRCKCSREDADASFPHARHLLRVYSTEVRRNRGVAL